MPEPGRRYISFYWRIAISFVLFLVLVLVGQGITLRFLLSRSSDPFAPGNPTATSAQLASALGVLLMDGRTVDPGLFLRSANIGRPVYAVMRDGSVASNSEQPLDPDTTRHMQAMVTGAPPPPLQGDVPLGPVVSAPIVANGVLEGVVVLPPPPARGVFSDLRDALSFPSTIVLIAASAVAAFIIFAPARRRLRDLETAAERLRRGELNARAPEEGQDEIARVSAAFNRMAEELAARSQALRESDRQRRQMLADVSHELRTPLTAMRGYLDTLDLAEVSVDEPTRRRYLETVRNETLRLERLVTDLVQLARFENDAAPFQPRVFDIERVFSHVMRRHERDAAVNGVTIRPHIQTGADQMVADPDRIEQVIGNLVANALRHTPADGTIDLQASVDDRAYRMAVIDSGAGIPTEHLPHVFERFYKVDASRVSGSGGSGLGLSIAKAIVERHGGVIVVTSHPGRTVFEITLPRQSASASANL